jgi:hypothetical protein
MLRSWIETAQNIRRSAPTLLALGVGLIGIAGGVLLAALGVDRLIAGAPLWSWAIVGGLLVLCVALFGYVVILEHRWPDFDAWNKEELRLFEAACLWVNQDPRLPMTPAARRQYKRLAKAFFEHNLPIAEDIDTDVRLAMDRHFDGKGVEQSDSITVNTRVYRHTLEELAQEWNERPRFLFPKERER